MVTRRVHWALCVGGLLSILLWCAARPASADERWTQVGLREGLLDTTIHRLLPLASGGLLVGTSRGLNLWDGRRWVGYSAGNGLAEGYITAAAQDGEALWAGSWGGGLAVLREGRWQRYTASTSPLPGNWVSDLAASSGGLWIATYGQGLAYLREGQWSYYTHASSGLPSDWLTCLLADTAGGLWVGTERAGLAYRTPSGHWETYPLPANLGTEVTALVLRPGELWAGTRGGVALLDLQTRRWRLLDQTHGLPGRRVTALALGAEGALWIGTEQGLARWFDGQITLNTTRDGLPNDMVSALAVDTAGRLWVGSYFGLAVRGELAMLSPPRLPVVLVHGWRGPDSDQLGDSEFWHLARWLSEDGFTPYYATGISPSQTLHANAVRLGEVIAQARRETGAEGVYLVAFSMGGLNARAYLESTLYQGDVLRAFILGTPHRGEELWSPLLLWEYLAWTDEPSALELMPVHAELFNRTHGNAWGVPYTLIAGDMRALLGSGDDTLLRQVPTLFRELPPSDGLVSTWSALGPEGSPADRRITPDIHAWGTETLLLGLPSLLLPRTTYEAHIRPYLLGYYDAPGTGSPRSPRDYTPPVAEPRSAYRVGTLQPGQIVTLTAIPLETGGRARFYVRWKGPAPRVSLRDPQGRLFDPDTATDNPQAEYLALDFADFASYVLTDTLAGPWQVVLSATAASAAPSRYVAYAAFSSTLQLQVTTDRPWYQIGEQVLVSASFTDTDSSFTGHAPRLAPQPVRVEVYDPDRQHAATLILAPGPAEGSDTQMGGRYVGSFVPQISGYYTLLFYAVGQRDAAAVERGAALLVSVGGDAARLSGAYTLHPGPRTASGQFSGLEATVGLVITRVGAYLCSLQVTDATGHVVTTVAHPLHLEPGAQVITVTIPGRAIRNSGLAGPYHLGEVTLLDIAGAAVVLDSGRDLAASVALQPNDLAP